MGSARFVILTLSTCLAGFVLLFAHAVGQHAMPDWLSSVVRELASVLITTGSIAALSSHFVSTDFVEQLKQSEVRIKNSLLTSEQLKRLDRIGIVDCYGDVSQYSFSNFIEGANRLSVCLNDGRTWLNTNLHAMRKHMSRHDSSTIVLLVNPSGPHLPVLAERTSQSAEYQAEKIRDTCRRLRDLHASIENAGDLAIYFHDLAPVNGLFLSEHFGILSEYTTSRPRVPVPLILATNTVSDGYYNFIKTDIDNLLTDQKTILVFSAQRGKIIVDDLRDSLTPGVRVNVDSRSYAG